MLMLVLSSQAQMTHLHSTILLLSVVAPAPSPEAMITSTLLLTEFSHTSRKPAFTKNSLVLFTSV